MYGFFLEIAGLLQSNNLGKKGFSSGMLASLPLPLPPSIQTFFTTSTMLWTRLL